MKFTDSTVCKYITSFPIAVLNEKIDILSNVERLGNCIWFIHNTENRKKQAMYRLENILSLTQVFNWTATNFKEAENYSMYLNKIYSCPDKYKIATSTTAMPTCVSR